LAFPQDKNPLVINWEVSLDGGQSWIAFGETRNVIYRVLSDPIVNTLYDLALTKACTYADGESTPLGAAQKICDGIDFDIYYDPSDTIGSEANPLKLYDTGVGMCEDHARLMSLLLKSIGIDGWPHYYWGGCSSLRICYYRYRGWLGPSIAFIGLGAHDGASVDPHFKFHAITGAAIDGNVSYFDPSYGVYEMKTPNEYAPGHPYVATLQQGEALPDYAHFVDWDCPH